MSQYTEGTLSWIIVGCFLTFLAFLAYKTYHFRPKHLMVAGIGMCILGGIHLGSALVGLWFLGIGVYAEWKEQHSHMSQNEAPDPCRGWHYVLAGCIVPLLQILLIKAGFFGELEYPDSVIVRAISVGCSLMATGVCLECAQRAVTNAQQQDQWDDNFPMIQEKPSPPENASEDENGNQLQIV